MSLHYTDERVTLHLGDCMAVMASLPEKSVDAIVTDPPYGINFMGKAWDNAAILGRAVAGKDHTTTRERSGSMHAGEYDVSLKGNHAFEEWTYAWAIEAFRVLKPGGHLISFSSARTYHRMAAGIEDAGFEIRDQLLWLYGSGFPKSMDISKQVDKIDAAIARRERDLKFTAWMRSTGLTSRQINELTDSNMANHYLTDKEQPTVATADMFNKLRPVLPEVPDWVEEMVRQRTIESENYKKRPVTGQHENPAAAQQWMANYDMPADLTPKERRDIAATDEAKKWQGWGTALKPAHEPMVLARKPLIGTVAANVVAHGTGGLNIDGTRGEGNRWPANLIHDGLEAEWAKFFYCAKTSKRDRNEGLDGFAVVDAADMVERNADSDGMKSPRAGAGRTSGSQNFHPTVKPTALMEYLIKLVTPPNGTVLDPFMGSGSTGKAAMYAGFNFIGIDMTPEYMDIAKARIAYAARDTETIEETVFPKDFARPELVDEATPLTLDIEAQ